MKKTVFFILAILLFIPFASHAQLGGLKQKAEEKAKQEAEKTKREAEEKAKQKAEQKVDEKTSGSNTNTNSGSTSTSSSSGTGTSSSSTSNSGSTNSGSTATTSPSTPPAEKLPYGEYTSRSDFESAHIGKMIFGPDDSQDDLEKSNKSDFKASEPISICFYLEHFLANYPIYKDGNPSLEKKVNSGFNYELKIFSDGKQIPSIKGRYSGTYVNFPTNFIVTLASTSGGRVDAREAWVTVVNSMSDGVHKMKFELWGCSEDGFSTASSVCTGEINFTKVENIGNWEWEGKKLAYQKTVDEFNTGKVKDNGATSETHKNNVGKIVFSKTHLGADGTENAAAIQSSFSGADQIYAKCFMKESFWNVPLYNKPTEYTYDTNFYSRTPVRNNSSTFTVVYLIDGKDPKDIPEIKNSPFDKYNEPDEVITNNKNEAPNDEESMKKKTTIELYIKTSKAEVNKDIGSNDWAIIANALTPGEHTIQITVWAGTKEMGLSLEPVCTGEFKYTKVAGLTVGVGKDWNVVAQKAGMSNPSLEAQMKALILKNEDVKGVSHLIITDSQWSIDRNDLTGIILSRSINAWCVVKNSEGYYEEAYCVFTEDYNGSGYQAMYGGVSSGGVRYYVDGNTLK